MDKSFLCFAHGREGDWEAICVDLDIAVQGESFDDVKAMLDSAIGSYVHDAHQEAPEVRDRLLSRTAPWYVQAKLALGMLAYVLFHKLRQKEGQANFSLPCRA